jgi:hypothetical protein
VPGFFKHTADGHSEVLAWEDAWKPIGAVPTVGQQMVPSPPPN